MFEALLCPASERYTSPARPEQRFVSSSFVGYHYSWLTDMLREPPVIISFKNEATENIYDGENTKAARKLLPQDLHTKAGQLMDRLHAAVSLESLTLPGLRLEKLRADRTGQHSIRINEKYRVCFRWTEQGAEDVEIVDYH